MDNFRYSQTIVGRVLCALLILASSSLYAQTNLARNGTATASTADLPASNVIDGSMNTRWASAAQTDPSHITVDLGQAYPLSRVTLRWEAATAGHYEIRGSNNGSNWTTLATRTGGTFGERTDNIDVSGTYRYVRMHGISRSPGNEWGYSIWEFEVYGQSSQPQDVTIQAEDYDDYHDNSAGNIGGEYRNDDVDIEATTDVGGGYNVGWTEAGEWLEYQVALNPGNYQVSTRVAADASSGNYTVLFNGNAIGSQSVANTGGWQSWITQQVGHLHVANAGTHTLRVNISGGDFNLNWIRLSVDDTGPVDITDLGGTVTDQFNDSPANERVANLIDNNANTKFLTFNASAWVRYQAPDAYVVNRYTLTSANDAPGRDPSSWTLQGSNNGSSWTTIDSRSNQSFSSRFQTREFTFTNATAYSYYRFNFNNTSGSILQLAEMQLFGLLGSGSGGNTPIERHGRLHVCGNQLCNQYNQPVQLRGMSTHGIQWYGWGNCLTAESLDTLAYDWNADVLRIAMYVQEGGYETNPTAFTNQVSLLIDEATSRGMYALVDFHQLTPGDPNYNLNNARRFFNDIVQQHQHKTNVIYDVANEPNGVPWSRIKSYAEQVIPVIRQHDPDAVVLIGTHGWGSMGTSDGRTAQDIFNNPVNASNIMYTFHFYADSHGQAYRDNLVWAAQRMPVFVTEFGTQDYTGHGNNNFVSSQAYLDILDQYTISWVNWNYSDDFRSGAVWQQGACASNNWSTSNLKEAGLWIRDKIRNR